MLNRLPIIGWLVQLVVSISISLPFWWCWTVCGLGKLYFAFLPELYQAIPFWDCVGLSIVIAILKSVFVPKLASVSQSNEK